MPFIPTLRTVLAGAMLLAATPLLDSPAGRAIGVLAWFAPIPAMASEPLSVTNIRIGDDTASIEIPSASVEGANLSQAELQSLFAGHGEQANGNALADRLAGLSAKRITIPELTIRLDGEYTTQLTRYFDVELRDIVDGVIGWTTARRSSTSQTVTWTDDDDESHEEAAFSGSSGETAVDALDVAFAARLLAGDPSSTTGDRSTRQLHGAFTVKDYRFKQKLDVDEEDGSDPLAVEVTVDSITGGSVLARRPRSPLIALFGTLEGVQDDIDELPADEKRAALIGFSDLLSSFDLNETTARNIAIRTAGRGPGADFTAHIESITFSYVDQQLNFAFNGASAASQLSDAAEGKREPDTISVGRFAVEDLSFKSAIAALDEAAKADLTGKDGGKAAFDGTLFVPTGGQLAVTDVKVDVDLAGEEDANPDRIAFSIKAFETTTGGHVANGWTRFETVLTDLHVALPETETDGLRELRALGYSELTLSSVFRGAWEEATRRLTIDDLSLTGVEIGSIATKAHFGNVSGEAHAGDVGLVLQALEEASLLEATLTLEDGGLFGRLVKQQATQGAGSEDEIRQQYAALATIGIPALIGETPTARKLATAVSRFATAPGKLSVTVRAKDPAGVPLKTIDIGAEPAKLLERFDVTTSN